jgi:small basic protein
MALFPLLALLIGFLLFWVPSQNFQANETIARYAAIAILAGSDTLLGGLRAVLMRDFDDTVFVSGFFVNCGLAAGLVALGEYFNLSAGVGDARISVMMIATVVIFSKRILDNLAALRRLLIERWRARHQPQTVAPSQLSAPSQPSPKNSAANESSI